MQDHRDQSEEGAAETHGVQHVQPFSKVLGVLCAWETQGPAHPSNQGQFFITVAHSMVEWIVVDISIIRVKKGSCGKRKKQ